MIVNLARAIHINPTLFQFIFVKEAMPYTGRVIENEIDVNAKMDLSHFG